MKKVVFVLIFVMLCCQGGTALAVEKQSSPTVLETDSKAVCTVIEDYLDAVNGSLSLSSTDVSFLDDFFAPQGKNALDYEKAFLNIKIVHHRQQDADLRLLHYEINPLYDKIEMSSTKARVELHISGTRIYAYDNISRNITNENHIFEMVMTPQGWRIANHIGNETLEQDFRSYYIKNNKDIEKTKQEALSEITADTKPRKNIAKNEPAIADTAFIDTTDVSILAYSSSYDRKAFAKYGKDWYDSENSDYSFLWIIKSGYSHGQDERIDTYYRRI